MIKGSCWVFFFALAIGLATPQVSTAETRCIDVFVRTHSGRFEQAPQFEAIFQSAQDFGAYSFQKAHTNILEISRAPELYNRVRELEEALTLLLAPLHPTSAKAEFIKNLLLVLPMTRPEAPWLWMLTVDQTVMSKMGEFNIHGTLGHLVRALPESEKSDLLFELGKVYERRKNYTAVHAIHVILDPLARYESFKRQGGTDREFYLFYLTLIQDFVFLDAKVGQGTWDRIWSKKPIGDYSGELPLRIAHMIRDTVYPTQQHPIEFFGSVVNGFGRMGSDLDIFNHPLRELIPNGHLSSLNGDLNSFRYPIRDKNFDAALANYLKQMGWNWKTEPNNYRLPSALYGGHSQPFLFLISKDTVELLFFPYSLSVDAKGQVDTRHFSHMTFDLTE